MYFRINTVSCRFSLPYYSQVHVNDDNYVINLTFRTCIDSIRHFCLVFVYLIKKHRKSHDQIFGNLFFAGSNSARSIYRDYMAHYSFLRSIDCSQATSISSTWFRHLFITYRKLEKFFLSLKGWPAHNHRCSIQRLFYPVTCYR